MASKDNYTRFLLLSRGDTPVPVLSPPNGDSHELTHFFALSDPTSISRLVERGKVVSIHTRPGGASDQIFPSKVLVELKLSSPYSDPADLFANERSIECMGYCASRIKPA